MVVEVFITLEEQVVLEVLEVAVEQEKVELPQVVVVTLLQQIHHKVIAEERHHLLTQEITQVQVEVEQLLQVVQEELVVVMVELEHQIQY